jgi:PhzF family phenazine biosynthesis protein
MALFRTVNVFTHHGRGGNPCPVVLDASHLSDRDMQAIARETGHESGFVLPATSEEFDLCFRFWVPNHEMEMCGHAAIGALWLLTTTGRLAESEVRITTMSGPVSGFIARGEANDLRAEITQPAGKAVPLSSEAGQAVLRALRLSRADLLDLSILNAVTSRVKTLIPLRDPDRLHALKSDMATTEAVCRSIGSTGLYPFAVVERSSQTFEARQFPRSSGYPEDAATGIAAAALAFGLLREGLIARGPQPIRILQGRAMGRLSEIRVRLGFAGDRAIGCLLGGEVTRDA